MDPTASSADTLPPGSRLLNYRIVRLLGRGGFGVIYLAMDVSLGHRVAVKEYMPSEISTRTNDGRVRPKNSDQAQLYQWGLNRFVKEARNLVRFRHPNIVRVSALFQENNTAYMVMDFEEGQSLRDYVREPTRRTEASLKALIEPITLGLSEVHRQGFIHRDIKPSNLLVRDSGSPVLIDFGSARLASNDATHGLTALVSSGYAPLEQYNPESEEQQGPWSDIYALGGVLYYCITQRDPTDSTQRSSAIVNGRDDPMTSAATVGEGLYSEAFLRAIDWALSVRIADRPQVLGDWIPALFATGVAPDASIATQRLLDQQTQASKPADAAPTQPTAAAKVPRHKAFDATDLNDEKNWDKAEPVSKNRTNTDFGAAEWSLDNQTQPNSYTQPANVSGSRKPSLGWIFGFAALGLVALGGWIGYQQILSRFETQQLVVAEQRRAADEALAKAEIARQEAIAMIAEQRERQAEQIRLGAERLLAERDTERQEAARQAQAEQDNAAQRAQAAARKEREDVIKRNRQNSLLDTGYKALDENDLQAAERALQQARAISISNSRLQSMAVALQAAQSNARDPISDSEFDLIVGEFHELKEAIERGDVAKVNRLTRGDEQLALFTRLIERFERLDMSITGIRARDVDKSIVGILRIDRMVRENGNRATPAPSYQDRQITSQRINGEWSSIVW